PVNSWCHVAVTLDGHRGLLFLNGEAVAGSNRLTQRPWQVLARTNYLGASQFAADPAFNGQIDSLRVFGRALSVAEVRDLAQAHPALAHRYRFNGDARDSVGMAHGTLVGNATVTDHALELTGEPGGYLALPGGLVSSSAAATFEFWATFGPNADWVRVFDFGTTNGTRGSEFVFYSPHTGSGGQRFEISTAAGTFTHDSVPTLDGQTAHLAIVLDPPNRYAAVYTNGVLDFETTTGIPALSGVSSDLAFLGRSLFAADGWLNATLEEFRIYDGRLSAGEIQANHLAGPEALALPLALSTARLGGQLELSWPSYGAGFGLQSVEQVSGGGWIPVAGKAAISEGRYRLSVPVLGDARWFRLLR
ncbi:MAG: LamG domain-containing protein, partial [Verrucomicrobiae bacterium]|nr:LamG domain-containing protein [Verrucomicrobiae bacterium]